MINITSDNEQLIKELFRDGHEVHEHYVRNCGGHKKYERMRDKLLKQCMTDHQEHSSGVYEYVSKAGNRWRMYDYARYFPDSDGAHVDPTSFVYYETFGSCGAFVPMHQHGSKDRHVIIFASHFFLRMCARLGIPYRSSAMIEAFLQMVPMMVIMFRDAYRNGKQEVAVGLPGSVGLGVLRYSNEHTFIFEIDTFLKNTELNNKKKKELSLVQNAQRVLKYEPEMMQTSRYAKMVKEGGPKEGIQAILKDSAKQLRALGHDKRVVEDYQNLFMWVVYMAIDQIPQNANKFALFKNANDVGPEMQMLYDASFRRIVFNEEWMSAWADVLMIAPCFYKKMTHKELEINRACQFLNETVGTDSFVCDDIQTYLDWYRKKCEEFDIENKIVNCKS